MFKPRHGRMLIITCLAGLMGLPGVASRAPAADDIVVGSRLLRREGDLASQMIDGIDRFLLRQLEQSVDRRQEHWQRDRSSAQAYEQSVERNRQRLVHILGVRDERTGLTSLQLLATTADSALVGKGHGFDAFKVRWPAFGDVSGEGLLLLPRGRDPIADVVAIPDADQQPEQIAGLAEGVPPASQFARRLAESGCRVVVPVLIGRQMERRAPPGRSGRANLTHREFLYRPAFELGRHLIGYEIQKVLACVDWFASDAGRKRKIGVIGYGEGGMLALYSAALDSRIDAAGVSGYFGSRQSIWQEPLDRNVFGLLEQFGDAEIASLVAPRTLVVDSAAGPRLSLPGEGGAPAKLNPQPLAAVRQEKERLRGLLGDLQAANPAGRRALNQMVIDIERPEHFWDTERLSSFLYHLNEDAELATEQRAVERLGTDFGIGERQRRQVHELDRHNQWLLGESAYVRQEFMKRLDTRSLAAYEQSIQSYRDFFREEVIGAFDCERLPLDPRSRKAYDEPRWTGYEVVLDVFPDVFAYGILCIPKGIQAGGRRPVVVCQHGLEGRPQQVVSGDHRAYHDFAAKLAERGFITFAPQNIYIFQDRFRTLQRKANPLKKTLFSIMVPQHQQIVDWLKSLPFVDAQRIAFYGLSYGGKSAMRIPALVGDYRLSICSADFNEWVWKNASSRDHHSYVWTGEYEIFEFDLGSTFNYAEMAALIAPRPFMVERGHFDNVAPDEAVAYEFAKVRRLYQARLGIGDRCEIEWFAGPHTINGQGTFEFLHKHLEWPRP